MTQHQDIKALLEIWSGDVIQAQLSGSYRSETRNCVPDNLRYAGTPLYPPHGEAVPQQNLELPCYSSFPRYQERTSHPRLSPGVPVCCSSVNNSLE